MPPPSSHPASAKNARPVDYYPLLANAIASLDVNTAETRSALFDRVRSMLVRQLTSAGAPHSTERLAVEQAALELAIERHEAEARGNRELTSGSDRRSGSVPTGHSLSSEGKNVGSRTFGARRYFPTEILLAALPLLIIAVSVLSANGWVGPLSASLALAIFLIICVLIVRGVLTMLWRGRRLRQAGFFSETGSASDLIVPCGVERPVSRRSYARMVKWRQVALIGFRVLTLIGLGLVIFATVAILYEGLHRADVDPGQIAAFIGLVLYLPASFLAYFVRNRALRILLLRPFGDRRMTSPLKRFVRKNLGHIAYVFTLSDRNYKPGFVDTFVFRLISGGFEMIIMLFFGLFFSNSRRVGSVTSNWRMYRLARNLLRQYDLATWSLVTGGQAFNIRSTDSWWKLCIQILMNSCEIIVVDLSRVKEGTAWELSELDRRGLMSKCLFVARADNQGSVSEVLEQYFDPRAQPVVHYYRDNGALADRAQFEVELQHLVETGLQDWARQLAGPARS